MSLLRKTRGTAGYLVLLLATHLIVFDLLSEAAGLRVLRGISTDLADLGWWFPVRLVGSALVADTSGDVLDTVLIIGVGVALCLGWLEWRLGTARAFAIFLGVHVVVTLVTLAFVAGGAYPDETRSALDYGVSYGAAGAAGAVTFFLPKWPRLPWAAFVVGYPLTAADWYGWLPDDTTVGHVLSAAAGVAISAVLLARKPAAATDTVHIGQLDPAPGRPE